jgi:hypothetical protein
MTTEPPAGPPPPPLVWHFSEDPSIGEFAPHVPATNPTMPPGVWAIDDRHAPLYWFPRDCPRITWWTPDGRPADRLGPTTASRVHAVESAWLDRIRSCRLHRYGFDAASFEPWPEADGQLVSSTTVRPVSVEPMGDLLDRHVRAGIELRLVPSLWPLRDAVVEAAAAHGYRFSMVRMRNAAARL